MRKRDRQDKKKESDRGRMSDDVKWNTRKRRVGLKRSKKSYFQKPRCQKMETNLLWMAGKPGSTCELHSIRWSSTETIPAPDEREREHDGKRLYTEE